MSIGWINIGLIVVLALALVIIWPLSGISQRRRKAKTPQRYSNHLKLDLDLNTPLPIIVHFQNMALPDAKIAMITERHFQHLFSLLGHSTPNFGNELSCHSCFLQKQAYLVIEYNDKTHILSCDALFPSHPVATPSSWEQALLVSQATAQDLGVSPSSQTATLKKFVLLCPNDANTLRYITDQQNKLRGTRPVSPSSIDASDLNEKLKKELEEILGTSPDKT